MGPAVSRHAHLLMMPRIGAMGPVCIRTNLGRLRRGTEWEILKMEWSELLSPKRVRELSGNPTRSTADHRSQFERDYDRAIFCTPVRRLHDKTQVFPLEPNDSVRTRLTHSLEVSTVSRDVAREIGRWLVKEDGVDEEQAKAIETIAATCGLIHDLGNPPFGHAGEIAIREWFAEHHGCDKDFFGWVCQGKPGIMESPYTQDFLKFEGNAQTIRLVSKLQVLADLHGLNFTCGTVSAACKYIAPSTGVNKDCHEKSKVGYFASEEELITRVREETGTGVARNPIAFIVEACDDIVYSVVDLEDGIKKRAITWQQLERELRAHYPGASSLLESCVNRARRMLEKGKECDPTIQTDDEAMSVAFRVYAISEMVTAMIGTFKEKYDAIMAGEYHGELIGDGPAGVLYVACKKVGIDHVYCADENLRKEIMGRRIMHDLMEVFWEAARAEGCGSKNGNKFARKAYELMSKNYRSVFKAAIREGKLPKEYCCMQLLTDYICGMTDTYACMLHRQLTNG